MEVSGALLGDPVRIRFTTEERQSIMRVLVSPASTHGGTAEIGRVIASTLRRYGLDVDVAQPEHLHDLGHYDGFVLGSALYRGKWKAEALELIEDHAEVICSLPCWLFSSGPITDDEPIEPLGPDEEDRLRRLTNARDHRLFGGRLDVDRLSAPERWLARWVKVRSGDARPWKEIERWAIAIAAELTAGHPLSDSVPPGSDRPEPTTNDEPTTA
jgi:menaquinone-dependent protoporphyrinogen oxidase